MTDRPALEDLDAEPEPARWCCNGNAEDCPLCTDPNPPYPFLCPRHPQTAGNERIVGEATQATEPTSWSQLEAHAFNAVGPALHGTGEWLPLSVRRKVARAVLATILGTIPDSTDTATWTTVRALQLMNEAGQQRDAAEARVRALEAEVAAARQFAGEMRDFCSPHGVAADYADRLVEAMDRAKGAS